MEFISRFNADPRPEVHHQITLRFFAKQFPDGLRGDVEEWALRGKPLNELPRLESEIAALRLVPMSERDIEARRSILKRRIIFKKTRHALCSACLRESSMRDCLLRNKRLKGSCSSTSALLEILNGSASVSVLATGYFSEKERAGVRRQHFKRAIYHADLIEQTDKRKSQIAHHEAADKAERKAQAKAAGTNKRPRMDFEAILAREWLSHFRSTTSHDDVIEIPANIGLDLVKAGDHQVSIATSVSAAPSLASIVPDLTLESDGDIADICQSIFEPAPTPTDTLLVKIMHHNPSSLKLIRPHAASGRSIDSQAVSVSVHKRLTADAQVRTVCARTSEVADGRFLLHGLVKHFRKLEQVGLSAWRSPSPAVYTIHDVTVDQDTQKLMPDICTTLV